MMIRKFFSGSATRILFFQRVAVDEEQVGERTLFHDAKLAWIGIALAGRR
jgi:hypothetical protein